MQKLACIAGTWSLANCSLLMSTSTAMTCLAPLSLASSWVRMPTGPQPMTWKAQKEEHSEHGRIGCWSVWSTRLLGCFSHLSMHCYPLPSFRIRYSLVQLRKKTLGTSIENRERTFCNKETLSDILGDKGTLRNKHRVEVLTMSICCSIACWTNWRMTYHPRKYGTTFRHTFQLIGMNAQMCTRNQTQRGYRWQYKQNNGSRIRYETDTILE